MNFLWRFAVGAALTLIAVTGTQAVVIVDMSPDAVGGVVPGANVSSIATRQNFLVQYTLGSAATLGGIDIYSNYFGAAVGAKVVVKIRADVAGAPSAANIFSLATTISALDSVGSAANPSIKRLHADFAATRLAAGTYWIGLSGIDEIGLNLQFAKPGSNGLWMLSDNNLLFSFQNHAQTAFRIDGVAAVPEPANWILLFVGFAFVGNAMRRRQVTAIAWPTGRGVARGA